MSDDAVFKAEEAGKLTRRQAWLPLGIIGVGVVLLISNLVGFHLMEILWPGFIIAPGLMLMWPAYEATPEHRSRLSFLAVPGAMVAMVGFMLFAMNLTNHFEAWAYSWPLIWAAAAGGLTYIYRFEPDHSYHELGHKFIRAMLILFAVLMVFFEIVIWSNFSPLVPLALIGYGFYLLVKNRQAARSV